MRVDITVGDKEKNTEQTATATSLTVRIAPIALFAAGIGLASYCALAPQPARSR